MRHVGVLLRVTLYRRLAELSFRGVAFTDLPREVVRHTRQDFDTVCGAVARQLASLFSFLKDERTEGSEAVPDRINGSLERLTGSVYHSAWQHLRCQPWMNQHLLYRRVTGAGLAK